MKKSFLIRVRSALIITLAGIILPALAIGQAVIAIDLTPIDGLPINPGNIFGYRLQSSDACNAQVKGTIRYRNSDLYLTYTYQCKLGQGVNSISKDEVHPQWQFSNSGLRELFFDYFILPEGTFEYCINITPIIGSKEISTSTTEECMYYRPNGIFLINLIYPEDKAKIKEFNPLLSWFANYSFSSALTYRLRVAEIKKGQNPVNAVMRNQPVFDEKNLMQNSKVYPVYAKPLEGNKPYAWTVDAYYKNILLGGSETWQFIIPTDSATVKYVPNNSYIDIRRENGSTRLYIVGNMKLKYLLDKYRTDELTIQITDENATQIPVKPSKLAAVYGDNRYEINLKDSCNLKHFGNYTMIVGAKTGERYSLPFKYINPEIGNN